MMKTDFANTIASWQQLARPRASDLEDTRLQLHWSAQAVASVLGGGDDTGGHRRAALG